MSLDQIRKTLRAAGFKPIPFVPVKQSRIRAARDGRLYGLREPRERKQELLKNIASLSAGVGLLGRELPGDGHAGERPATISNGRL